jgi:hypothetical protein
MYNPLCPREGSVGELYMKVELNGSGEMREVTEGKLLRKVENSTRHRKRLSIK